MPAVRVAYDGWRLWLLWTAATTLAVFVGTIPGTVVLYLTLAPLARALAPLARAGAGPAWVLPVTASLSGAAGGLVVGVTVGVAQAFVLHSWLPRVWTWLPATAFGWLAGGALAFPVALRGPLRPVGSLAVSLLLAWGELGVIVGLAVGLCQWLALRRWRQSSLWIVGSGLGWALGASIGRLVLDTFRRPTPTGGPFAVTQIPAIDSAVAAAAGALVAAAVTGVLAVRLARTTAG